MVPNESDGIRTPSRYMIEPDYVAGECDDQLPTFSKIGRGPRGKGVYTEIEKTDDGQVVIHFKDDETGEEIGNTGDIAAGRISVSYAPENPVAGDEVKMFVSVRSGSSVANYVVPVPSGAHGSRIYLFPGPVVRNDDDTYQCSVDDLTIYGLQLWESKPEPRPNDVILFNYEDSDGNGFAFGTIEAVESSQVVYTAHVFNTLPGVSILPDGTWGVDGESTGIKAQGPKGEDAKIKVRREVDKAVITATDSDGETTAEVLDGKDGRDANLSVRRIENGAMLTATDANGVTTAAVRDGSNGEDGSDGLPAMLTLGSVQETSQPQVTLVPGRVQMNEWIISFGLPRGADGKSIDINGGVYRVDQLPDFDETPVNDAFIVIDDDDRFDLYIRGKEAVIAEEGGPWTVVEDWQGVNGYSMRMLAGRNISADEVLRIPVGEAETAFVPHKGLRDGDLAFDDNGTIGIVGSAMDDSGDYTVSYVDKMNVHWDNIDGKPMLTSTDSIELTESDGQVTANLRLSGEHNNAEFSTADNEVVANLGHNVTSAGLGDHALHFSSDGFKVKDDSGTIALSDDVTASLGKANSAIQEDNLTAAIAAEASAREKADQLLETEVDGKLDAADLVAGENVTIVPNLDTGQVTISATGGELGTLPVASEDTLGGVKPSDQVLVADDGVMSLARDSVTYNELANNSVMVSHLTDLCVSATKIQNNAVGTDKIVDKAITAEKIADGIIPDTSTLIAKPTSGNGSPGQMLTTNGDGTTQWADVSEGTAYIAGDGLQIQDSEISIRTSNVSTVAVGGGSEDVVTFNMDHVFGPEDGAMQGHSLRADASFFDHASNTLTLKNESITADQLSQNINVSKFSNDAGYQNLAQVNEAVNSILEGSIASLEDFRSYMDYVAS